MDVPSEKNVGPRLTVSVASHGWPYWAHVRVDNSQVGLNREEAHDLLYAMTRICAYLDAREREDEASRTART